jgi:hypothetical protein
VFVPGRRLQDVTTGDKLLIPPLDAGLGLGAGARGSIGNLPPRVRTSIAEVCPAVDVNPTLRGRPHRLTGGPNFPSPSGQLSR